VRYLAGMGVPETSMHKNQFAPSSEHNVRFAGQVAAMKPVSIAKAKEDSPHRQFRGCVLAGDSAHVFASGKRVSLWPGVFHSGIMNLFPHPKPTVTNTRIA
jgi:hypothetical protein